MENNDQETARLGLSSQLIDDPEQLDSIAESWNALSESDPQASLCNSWPWIHCWINQYWRASYTLQVYLFRIGDRPFALLPLYYNGERGKTLLLGTGEEENAEVASEYTDILIDDSVLGRDPTYRILREEFFTTADTEFEFSNCLSDSHLASLTENLKHVISSPTGREYSLDLSGDFDSVYQGFSKNHRKKSREIMNRFSRQSALVFQPLNDEDYLTKWQKLRELHTRDWNMRGKPGAFAEQVFSRFHNQMHAENPGIRQLFCVLQEDGEIIAINHYYQYRQVLHFYASGTDKSRAGNLSPGILLHLLCIDSLCGSGLRYDFMKGGRTGSYKGRFCAPGRTFLTIRVFRPGLAGLGRLATLKARFLLARLKRRLRGVLRN